MKVVRSSGNVFADIGIEPKEAEALAVKSDLVTLVARAIKLRGLTQREAARLCGTEQATLSKVLGGKLRSVTIDRLARWLLALGWNITITAEPRSGGRRRARGAMTVSTEHAEA
jgi:predicted XRE-type DNA-binding protein